MIIMIQEIRLHFPTLSMQNLSRREASHGIWKISDLSDVLFEVQASSLGP